MRRVILITLKVAISLGLILLLYRKTPISQIGELAAGINLGYLPAIGLLLLVNTIISAGKWRLFLKADGVSMSLFDLTVSYMSGTFCNLFLPSNIGGDAYRVYDIARQSKDGARSAASVFADRFSGFIALVMLSLGSSIFVSAQFHSSRFVVVPLLLLICFIVVLFLLLRPALIRSCLRISGLNRIGAVDRLSEKLFLSFSRYGSNTGLLIKVMTLSLIFQLSVITVVFLMAKALGASVPFFYFSAFVPLITLMEALPISIYGIGVRDYGYVFFFSQVGMSDIETRTLALFFMAVAICYSLIGGLFFIYRLWVRPAMAGEQQTRNID